MFLRYRQRRLQSWERIRTKGKLRFVLDTSFRTSLPLIVGLPLMYLFLGMLTLRLMVLFMVGYLFIVPLGALVEWWKNEGAYLSAKLDRRTDLLKKP